MRTYKKPDLLFVLVVFVGLGVIISSYIQYERANANASDSTMLASKKSMIERPAPDNQFIQVSTPGKTISLVDSGAVNNSLQEP